MVIIKHTNLFSQSLEISGNGSKTTHSRQPKLRWCREWCNIAERFSNYAIRICWVSKQKHSFKHIFTIEILLNFPVLCFSNRTFLAFRWAAKTLRLWLISGESLDTCWARPTNTICSPTAGRRHYRAWSCSWRRSSAPTWSTHPPSSPQLWPHSWAASGTSIPCSHPTRSSTLRKWLAIAPDIRIWNPDWNWLTLLPHRKPISIRWDGWIDFCCGCCSPFMPICLTLRFSVSYSTLLWLYSSRECNTFRLWQSLILASKMPTSRRCANRKGKLMLHSLSLSLSLRLYKL